MSESPTWFSVPFAAQRRTLEGSRQLARTSIELQRRMARGASHSLDAQRDAEREAMTLLESALSLWLTAARASAPGAEEQFAELEANLEESFASMDEAREELWPLLSRVGTDGLATYDDLLRTYGSFLDLSFEAATVTNDRLERNLEWALRPEREPVEVPVRAGEP